LLPRRAKPADFAAIARAALGSVAPGREIKDEVVAALARRLRMSRNTVYCAMIP